MSMGEELLERLEEDINNYGSMEDLRDKFIREGYLEKDIDEAIFKLTKEARKLSHTHVKAIKIFTWKEILDRVGYGFVTHQFINILLYMTGAGYFLIGLVNGFKSILSVFLSSFLHEYSKLHDISKGVISKSGIIFGFSFLLIAAAIKLQWVWLFVVSLLIGSIGVVTYGDFYNKIIRHTVKKEKMNQFLVRISYYGILITVIAFLISGYLMDHIPWKEGLMIGFNGAQYPVYGYLIAFEISAFAFIVSGYFISFLDYRPQQKTYRLSRFISEYFRIMGDKFKVFSKNKGVFMMLFVSVLLGVVQVLGNSYYGIYIYRNFNNLGFGGFMNVAVVFSAALLVSFVAPAFTKKLERVLGLAPMIVFGVLLTALMPFALAYNRNLPAIVLANALSVFGAVIVGVAMGLLAKKLMNSAEREDYYTGLSAASILPMLVLVPLGAYLAPMLGLNTFFIILAGITAFLIMPLAFALVYHSRD